MWRSKRTLTVWAFILLLLLLIEKYYKSWKKYQDWLQRWFPVNVVYLEDELFKC